MGMCIQYAAVSRETQPALLGGLDKEIGFGRIVPLTLATLLATEPTREPWRRAIRDDDWGVFLRDPEGNRARGIDRVRLAAMLGQFVVHGGPPSPMELPVISPLWGGPPARVFNVTRAHAHAGFARLAADLVKETALALAAHDEASLRVEYRREQPHLKPFLSEDDVVAYFGSLRNFFATAVAAGNDVVVWWEYG